MKLPIKSSEPLKYNAMYTDYGKLNNFKSIPKELKFSYSRKKEITKLYIGLGVVGIIVVILLLDFVKLISVDNQLFYCILFFVVSIIGLGWFQLDRKLDYLLSESHFKVNDIQVSWKDIEQIDTVVFDSGGSSVQLTGIKIIVPGIDEIVIVTNDINDFSFERVDLPQLVYMFWRRGLEQNPESNENQDS